MTSDNLHELKSQLRKEIKQRRDALPEQERLKKNVLIHTLLNTIPAFCEAKSVFCYLSYLSEVSTHELIDGFLERQMRIAVPKIVDKTVMQAAVLLDRNELAPDKMGILTPQNEEIDPGPFDIAITPGLAFTREGGRLGYGRGYYDRWFLQHEVGIRIGVAYEAQLVEKLPMEDFDVPLHMLVTEEQVYDFR